MSQNFGPERKLFDLKFHKLDSVRAGGGIVIPPSTGYNKTY